MQNFPYFRFHTKAKFEENMTLTIFLVVVMTLVLRTMLVVMIVKDTGDCPTYQELLTQHQDSTYWGPKDAILC